jgi:hypothetical protein
VKTQYGHEQCLERMGQGTGRHRPGAPLRELGHHREFVSTVRVSELPGAGDIPLMEEYNVHQIMIMTFPKGAHQGSWRG